jgi:nickel transport system substrate-binding protein
MNPILSLLSLSLSLLLRTARADCTKNTLTVAAAAQTGIFKDTGPMNPHAYRPNEFVTNNWVYEGLVAYGADGRVEPALAVSWTQTDTASGSSIDFVLRRGVAFHDGQPWNAAACARNFEMVMHAALRNPDAGIHDWFALPAAITGWTVVSEFVFRLQLAGAYYPALQELTFIRPLRFLSPAAMFNGTNDNTCPPSWGNFSGTLNCVGIKAPIGTGPFSFDRRVNASAADGRPYDEVVFAANRNYWGPQANVDQVRLVVYPTREMIAADLAAGKLDVSLSATTVADFAAFRKSSATLRTALSDPLNTRLLLINTNRWPTDDVNVRQAIINAIDKETIVRDVLFGVEEVANHVFSPTLPFCDVVLTPPPAFDPVRANLLLDASGWLKNNSDSNIRYKDGAALELLLPYTEQSTFAEIEADIVSNLRVIGIRASSLAVPKDQYNAMVVAGNFSAVLTESWGAPYDPHSTANSWRTANEGDGIAQQGMRSPNKTEFNALIASVLSSKFVSSNAAVERDRIAGLWREILTSINNNSVYAPISYTRNYVVAQPNVLDLKLGHQQFDFPLTSLYCEAFPPTDVQRAGTTGASTTAPTSPAASGIGTAATAAIIVVSLLLAMCLALGAFLVIRERQGRPVFKPLLEDNHNHASYGSSNGSTLKKFRARSQSVQSNA